MIPPELATLAGAVPVIAVLLMWLSQLQQQVRELREQRDRWVTEYMNHLKGQYNLAVELELKKRYDEQTEPKPGRLGAVRDATD